MAQRQQYLNPINGKKNVYDLKQIEGIQAKIKELDEKIDNLLKTNDIKKLVKEIVSKELKNKISISKFESKILTTEKEIIELSNQGYDCRPIGKNKWLIKRKLG
jgi:Ni,Fe-hydrogenase III large subunit